MNIVIASEATMLISLPSSGNVTLFINTDKSNILYYVDSSGNFFTYNANDASALEDCCACDIAKSWIKAINCALNSGLLTATEYGVIMEQGLTITSTETVNSSTGSITRSVNVGPRINVDVAVSSIVLSGNNSVSHTATTQMSAAILPLNATDQDLIWVSSDISIATISQTGLVTGVATGVVTIYAYSQSTPSVFGTRIVTFS